MPFCPKHILFNVLFFKVNSYMSNHKNIINTVIR